MTSLLLLSPQRIARAVERGGTPEGAPSLPFPIHLMVDLLLCPVLGLSGCSELVEAVEHAWHVWILVCDTGEHGWPLLLGPGWRIFSFFFLLIFIKV